MQTAGTPNEKTEILRIGGFEGCERLFGDYMLGRQIGAGGMGVVYEAVQQSTNRKVAVKVLRDPQCASPVILRRFTLETEAAARLEHPNIVRVLEVGESNGYPFFSMDLVAGQSLSAAVAARQVPFHWPNDASPAQTRRQLETIVRLMVKITRAIQHAHQRGVLHRDLKPGNVIIDSQGEPHLTDFGLAKILCSALDPPRPMLTTDANLPGTPNYMPPEQVAGSETSRASDIYGLGAIFYELLTGQPPFSGATPFEIFKQIGRQPPLRPRRLNRAIDRALETICLKCLEKNPAHRYISAEALAEDLERWLANRPILARRPSLARQASQWSRRNPVGATLIATLCVGLTVALCLLHLLISQRDTILDDRIQTFEEGMSEISLLWQDSNQTSVTLSPRKLAILADVVPGEITDVKLHLTFGVATEFSPATIGQWYAYLLTQLQRALQQELGEPVLFSLKLYKRLNEDEFSLARGEVDLMMLSPVDYLKAKSLTNDVSPVARENMIREVVIFAHTNSPIDSLAALAGRSFAFPDPDLSLTVHAKARLAAAGLTGASLRVTNIVDRGPDPATRESVLSILSCMYCVLKKEFSASVTYRDRFERYKHLGLIAFDSFPEDPNILAARPGLDPRVIRAVQRVIHLLEGRPGFDSASLGLPSAMAPVDDSYFQPLREALLKANHFDKKPSL